MKRAMAKSLQDTSQLASVLQLSHASACGSLAERAGMSVRSYAEDRCMHVTMQTLAMTVCHPIKSRDSNRTDLICMFAYRSTDRGDHRRSARASAPRQMKASIVSEFTSSPLKCAAHTRIVRRLLLMQSPS